MHIKDLQNTQIDELEFSVVDVETTGMHPQFNRIMDIGIVSVKNMQIVETWETLIDPKQDVPFFITYYTKLRYKDVEGKPTFDAMLEEISTRLAQNVFVAHNVSFDYSFLANEFKRHDKEFNYPRLCTVKLGRKLLPQLANAHLDALADHYNLKITQRHRALPDAYATAQILINFINIAKKKYNAKTYFDLERIQRFRVNKHAEQTNGLLF